MSIEPITLFARLAHPDRVARKLRELVPNVMIDGKDESWHKAIVTFGKLWKKRKLIINHDPAYYSEPNWSAQMSGMAGYFSSFPESERKQKAVMLISTFSFSLATVFEPDCNSDDDPRLDILYAITELVDGVLFTPSSLRDARGRVLFGADEAEEDPNAKWPKVIARVSIDKPVGPRNPEESETATNAPSAERVARRALGMTALTVRAIIEQDAARSIREATKIHKRLMDWIEGAKIDDIEPDEWKVIQRTPGRLDTRMQTDSTWRLEGLVVLAWALGKYEIPPHDELVAFNAMWEALGVFDVDAAKKLIQDARLKQRPKISALRNRLFSLHWRLRNFGTNKEVLDFKEFAQTAWFGPLDLKGLPFMQGDLAIQGKRLDRASEDEVSSANSAAQERHQATNWLWEGPDKYSDASVAT